MHDPVFCLMGPTASGKTALAFELVKHFPMEVISVDSAMIYREMNIGTAKPDSDELKRVPHHLLDIIEPTDSYSAAHFCDDATRLIKDIHQRGKIPLLVGGTMMYFNALQNGLNQLPEANQQVRQHIEEEAQEQGWSRLHEKLKDIDPVTAARIHNNDTQRIQRALEVYYLTGTPLSVFLAEVKSVSTVNFINLALFPQDRSWLHQRIAQRFTQMLQTGFMEEVIHLQKKWILNMEMPSMRCVGYRQALEYLQGEYDYSTLIEKGIAATRQLAKRQLTWLRHWKNIDYFDPLKPGYSVDFVAKIREILDNPL